MFWKSWGGSPGEKGSVGRSYGCINITPILTNDFLELLQILGKIPRSVACKAIFLGMGGSSALVGNADTGNVFIQCEQLTSIVCIMGYTQSLLGKCWKTGGKKDRDQQGSKSYRLNSKAPSCLWG